MSNDQTKSSSPSYGNARDEILREAATIRIYGVLLERPDSCDSLAIWSGMILGTLTSRELDVLRLMRGDLSVREIGAELYISHNTAKGYAKTIYQKLGVNSRRDAVDTALAVDLI